CAFPWCIYPWLAAAFPSATYGPPPERIEWVHLAIFLGCVFLAFSLTAIQKMRHTIWILGVAILLTAVLSLPHYSGHALAAGANEWKFQSFGWPVEIWSRYAHTYRSYEPSPGVYKEIYYPTEYSVMWTRASLLFATAVGVASVSLLSLRHVRKRFP